MQNFNQTESKIIWTIIRQTYGWNKKEAPITSKEFCEKTGLIPQHISRSLRHLKERKIVTKIGNKYSFNKNNEEWCDRAGSRDLVTNLGNKKLLPILVTKVTNPGNKLLPIQVTRVTNLGNKKSWILNLRDSLELPKDSLKTYKDNIKTGKTENELFDFFWFIYPNKKSKKISLKNWEKLKMTEELFRKIIQALFIQMSSKQWKSNNGNFIPHPSTWINQERWDDEDHEALITKNFNI